MAPVRAFPAGGKCWGRVGIDVVNYLRGAAVPDRLIHTEGTIISQGEGRSGQRTHRRARRPVLLPSATSLKRTIFLPALQFAGNGTEDGCREAWWRIPFKQTFRDDSRERERKGDGHRFDGIRSSSSSSSSLVVPLLFQLSRHSACHRSVSHSFLVSKKEESKTPRQNFSASPSIRGMITVREGRFSLSRSLFSLPCLSSPFLPFFSILSFSIEESAKRAIVFCLSQHPRFHNNRVGV